MIRKVAKELNLTSSNIPYELISLVLATLKATQQVEIYQWCVSGVGNAMVDAKAGSAKRSTIGKFFVFHILMINRASCWHLINAVDAGGRLE